MPQDAVITKMTLNGETQISFNGTFVKQKIAAQVTFKK